MKKILGALGCAVLIAALSGCATSRSTVQPMVQATVNPDKGEPVKFAKVEDLRVFELDPKTPDIPSLRGGEITNKELTVRAIGRKRNGFGMALGDVLLPEGAMVADAVQESAANAFRYSGYRVLKQGDQGFDTAVPVTIRIRQFWSWINLGFWAGSLSNRIEAEVQAPLRGLEDGIVVKSEIKESVQAVFEDDWRDMSARGLENFQVKLQGQLPH